MKENKFCYHCFNKYRYSGVESECEEKCKSKIVYFMRGVPGTGKSYTANLIAGQKGRVIETDAYFGEPSDNFKFIRRKRKEARKWVFEELKKAINNNVTPIVIDRGNNPAVYPKKLMQYAVLNGYTVELAEPISENWQIIRTLLSERPFSNASLKRYSNQLAQINANTHHVKADKIYKRLLDYNVLATVDSFLNYDEKNK
jgi:dephospho-CoA kinase